MRDAAQKHCFDLKECAEVIFKRIVCTYVLADDWYQGFKSQVYLLEILRRKPCQTEWIEP